MTLLAGAGGGLIVEVVAFLADLNAYRQARKTARGKNKKPPHWGGYFDPVFDAAAGVTRLLLGAGAAVVFQSQLTTVFAAVAVGSSAPALLGQLGTARTLREVDDLTSPRAPVETAEEQPA
ncbi:hypothetical protein [Nocardia gamkensis]|uniref:hypothetical protein n=1 Tax=Nocardia TaxID=1817 RepID=UPI00340BBFB4